MGHISFSEISARIAIPSFLPLRMISLVLPVVPCSSSVIAWLMATATRAASAVDSGLFVRLMKCPVRSGCSPGRMRCAISMISAIPVS